MPYIELINRVMKEQMGAKGLAIVKSQLKNLRLEEIEISVENLPALARAISEAVVAISTREKAKMVYWELFKLLDIESIVDGTEDPALKAAQLADLGDAMSYAGESEKALEYYRQIPDTRAPGATTMAEIKEGELHDSTNQQKEAREHFETAVRIAKENGNFYMEALAHKGIGHSCWRTGEYPEAIERFNKAISVAMLVDDQDLIAKLYIDIGLVHQATGLNNEAIAKFQEAIDILKEAGNYDELARAYNNLGEAYKEANDRNKALESYQNCLEAAEKVKNDVFKAFALLNSAECYARSGFLEEATETLEKGRKSAEELGDEYLISSIYLINGIISTHKEEWESAEENYEKAIALLKDLGYPYELAINTFEYARMLRKKGEVERAKEKLLGSREIAIGLSSTLLIGDIDAELEKLG
ncbi:MAG: tetratricopeptide repeat protein [Thermoplasmata archaeon]|nr:tetratricopeptide repeat protein [Thermoplasmata archaeon]